MREQQQRQCRQHTPAIPSARGLDQPIIVICGECHPSPFSHRRRGVRLEQCSIVRTPVRYAVRMMVAVGPDTYGHYHPQTFTPVMSNDKTVWLNGKSQTHTTEETI